MNATQSNFRKTDLAFACVSAGRLEHGAEEYCAAALHFDGEFGVLESGITLRFLPDTQLADAEFYKNFNYQYAGVCRYALEASLQSEHEARQAIERAMNPLPIHPKEDSKHDKS